MSLMDPITEVENLIWEVLEANPQWVELVKPGNRIKLTDGRANPMLDRRMDADLPAAFLRHAPFRFNVQRGSGTATIEANFIVEIQTGDQRTGSTANDAIVGINRLLWQTFRAFETWATTARQPFPFLVPGTLRLVESSPEFIADTARPGWSFVCQISALLKWNRSEVIV